MTTCLFCNNQEPGYRPRKDVDFLCSTCTRILLGKSQEELKRGLAKALALNNQRQVMAIRIFVGEEEYVPETRETRSNLERERSVRPSQSTSH